jgi:hypothetical protein
MHPEDLKIMTLIDLAVAHFASAFKPNYDEIAAFVEDQNSKAFHLPYSLELGVAQRVYLRTRPNN